MHGEALSTDISRFNERCIRVAHRGEITYRQISRLGVKKARLVLRSISTRDIRHRRKRGYIKVDYFHGIFCNGAAFRDDDRNGLTDIAHLAACNNGLAERLELRQWGQSNWNERALIADALGCDNGMYPFERQRGRCINLLDRSVRPRAA